MRVKVEIDIFERCLNVQNRERVRRVRASTSYTANRRRRSGSGSVGGSLSRGLSRFVGGLFIYRRVASYCLPST